MILFDTETTGLVDKEAVNIRYQPHIIEFAAISFNDTTFEPEYELEFLCKPPIPIISEVVKITSITDAMVADEPPLDAYIPDLIDFFLGQRIVAAHNLSFDIRVLYYELMRRDMVTKFPWPSQHICTVECSESLEGHRIPLGRLHELATGKPHKGAHRAMDDVRALSTCLFWLHKKGLVEL